MPGDMSAIVTTFSIVVLDGPWICSAEMQASISFCRWRVRSAFSGTGAARALRVIKLGIPVLPPSSITRGQTTDERHGRAPDPRYRRTPHGKAARKALAHHTAAAPVPAGVFPDPIYVRAQDQRCRVHNIRSAI